MLPRDLGVPFPHSVHQSFSRGGKAFTSIPIGEVVARLNRVLSDGWSYEILRLWREDDFCLAHVRLCVGGTCREGVGGSEISRYSSGQRQGQPVELGDDYKSAVSAALKKAAWAFGVGLELSRETTDDQVAIEEAIAALSPAQADWLRGHWKAQGLPRPGHLAPTDFQVAWDLIGGAETLTDEGKEGDGTPPADREPAPGSAPEPRSEDEAPDTPEPR